MEIIEELPNSNSHSELKCVYSVRIIRVFAMLCTQNQGAAQAVEQSSHPPLLNMLPLSSPEGNSQFVQSQTGFYVHQNFLVPSLHHF